MSDDMHTAGIARGGFALLTTAAVLLLPGLVAGFAAPIPYLFRGEPPHPWADSLWMFGFAAGLIACLATPLGLLTGAWGIVRTRDRTPWKGLAISIMSLSVIGLLAFILLTVRPMQWVRVGSSPVGAVEQSVEADKPRLEWRLAA